VELLELAVILLFWFFDTPSRVDAQASAAPACPNTSPLPLVLHCTFGHVDGLWVYCGQLR